MRRGRRLARTRLRASSRRREAGREAPLRSGGARRRGGRGRELRPRRSERPGRGDAERALDVAELGRGRGDPRDGCGTDGTYERRRRPTRADRKSTRLNSSHGYISYAVFCLKKKKKK